LPEMIPKVLKKLKNYRLNWHFIDIN
jgi:hypothetical protein